MKNATNQSSLGNDQMEDLSEEYEELLASLPKEKGWRTTYAYQYEGFWCPAKDIAAVVSVQKHFKANDTDLILTSLPKSGTTWMKALMFSIVNRKRYTFSNSPLLTRNPHDLVPLLEYGLYANNQIPNLNEIAAPRLFQTHVPYPSLPGSMKNSNCKIVYISRNPLDTFVSFWHFSIKGRPKSLGTLTLEEALDMFCRGISVCGPFWDHALGYWRKSLESPNKVLFVKYEDLKEETVHHLKIIAEFIGFPFSMQEEKEGVIEKIKEFCSFDNMKEMEPNKNGKVYSFDAKAMFRKGEVGDWVNYMTPLMAERLNKIMEEKFGGSGLSFKVSTRT